MVGVADAVDGGQDVVSVKAVDLCTTENGPQHHTEQFELMEREKDSRLVVRRGQEFLVRITLSRSYDDKNDAMSFIFTLEDAEKPSYGQGTMMAFPLLPVGAEGGDDWNAVLDSIQENIITVKITSSATCIVGKWKFDIDTKVKNNGALSYSHKDSIYILYNPWCRLDQVFMEGEDLRAEYILADTGLIWRGSYNRLRPSVWKYAQFEKDILDCSLYLITKIGKVALATRGDPVKISRALSAATHIEEDLDSSPGHAFLVSVSHGIPKSPQWADYEHHISQDLVNSPDDNGAVMGNWSDDFGGGTAPTKWIGSMKILQQFYKNKKPVKYGQCWVFAGVLTTLCRALGIPSRPVTTYSAAHDTQNSLTVDYFVNEAGEIMEELNSDSIWRAVGSLMHLMTGTRPCGVGMLGSGGWLNEQCKGGGGLENTTVATSRPTRWQWLLNNQRVELTRQPLPCIDDILASLRNGKVILTYQSNAYKQIVMGEESRELVTVNTHKGLYRYRRLPFGLSSALGIFQAVTEQILLGIPRVVAYLDDILITGESRAECGNTPNAVLQRLREYGVRVNDVSQYGVGAVLALKMLDGTEQPVCFASKTLSKAEQGYGQAEMLKQPVFQLQLVQGLPIKAIDMTFQRPQAKTRYFMRGIRGVVWMKMLGQSYVWWPGLDSDIEETVKTCTACQLARPSAVKEPVVTWPETFRVWECIHVDFAEKEALASYGLPEMMVADNGPQFRSEEFARFCEDNAITLRLTTPFHPQSNRAAEGTVQIIKSALLKQAIESRRTCSHYNWGWISGCLHIAIHRKQQQRGLRRKLLVKCVRGEWLQWLPGLLVKVVSPVMLRVKVGGMIRFCHRDHLRQSFLHRESSLDPKGEGLVGTPAAVPAQDGGRLIYWAEKEAEEGCSAGRRTAEGRSSAGDSESCEDVREVEGFKRFGSETGAATTVEPLRRCGRPDSKKGSLTGFSDTNKAGDEVRGRSTTGVRCMYGGGVVSWLRQGQTSVASSATEAEVVAASEAGRELVDYEAATRLPQNPEYHRRTKHIQIQHFFVRKFVIEGELDVTKVSTLFQLADLLMKPFLKPRLQLLCSKMGLNTVNFHVWNEVWMDRPDMLPAGAYGGWQAIDATPQEISDNMFRCGPASVTAIRQGEVQLSYDNAFVYSEVNADKVFWRYTGPTQPLKLLRKDVLGIGQLISTKGVGSWKREDITDNYKYPEKSDEERAAMLKALRQSASLFSRYYLNEDFNDIQFNFELRDDIVIGSPFTSRLFPAIGNNVVTYSLLHVCTGTQPGICLYVVIAAASARGKDQMPSASGGVATDWLASRGRSHRTGGSDGMTVSCDVTGRPEEGKQSRTIIQLVLCSGEKMNLVVVVMKNRSRSESHKVSVILRVDTVMYTGSVKDSVKKISEERMVTPGAVEEIRLDVSYDEYYSRLVDQCAFNIACLASVVGTNYEYFAQDDFRVRKPDIKIKVLHLPLTMANRVQSSAGSPNFRKWESCQTMPVVGWFSWGSPISPAPSFQRRSIFTPITLIGSQDLALEGNAVQGQELSAVATLKNPLPIPLKKGQFQIEGPGLATTLKLKLPQTVPTGGEALVPFKMTPKFPGRATIIAKFTSKELEDVDGFLNFMVEPKMEANGTGNTTA
ncbi:hypothetical protein PR048_033382 [Dryococelus australis]|uniref:Integrase catalytic domain-containing protein n=1 Tax=Dryococelus australis TaxID=614101 RepID=A0ABQ9G4B0_9NEOP|nr:hypothetical protein PR048_033382 [Dryococelus australis]